MTPSEHQASARAAPLDHITELRRAQARQIILISSRSEIFASCAEHLAEAGFEVMTISHRHSAIDVLLRTEPPAAVVDLTSPDDTGMDILEAARAENISTKLIAISEDGSLKRAVKAMKLGAFDYLPEPFEAERLVEILHEAVEDVPDRPPRRRRPRQIESTFQGFVGSSPEMHKVYETIEKAAKTSTSVFITGESGTGKEICAHAIHSCSPRQNQPFVTINCAAIPKTLLESEIFGHVKGAFTGATNNRPGLATEAHGGTLFLDEICELELDVQAKLLRLVQHGTFQRIGSNRLEQVDVRIVCATNRDPEAEVEAGRFREDLFYRLHVIPIHLPPLRERGNDIIEIARHFLFDLSAKERKSFQGLTPDAEARLRSHTWPGNVRELQNALYNAITLNDDTALNANMLPATVGSPKGGNRDGGTSPDAPDEMAVETLESTEKAAILKALDACDNNVTRAAAQLGISVSTIYRKKAEWQAVEKSARSKSGS